MKTEYINLANYNRGGGIYVFHGGKQKNDLPVSNDCYMAAYIAHGSGMLKIGNDNISVSENDVFLVRPYAEYRFMPEDGLRRIDIYFCFFTFDIISDAYRNFNRQFGEFADFCDADNKPYLHAVDTDVKEIRDIYIRMIDEYMSALPGSNEILKGYLLTVITKILRNTRSRDFKRIYSKDRTVDETIRYINHHMYSKVSLNSIASHMHLSPSFICRRFKQYTGLTTSQFINFLRVNKIKDILQNTDKPVKAVPEMFNCNVEYLKKVFKRETGMTMQEYWEKYNYKNLG